MSLNLTFGEKSSRNMDDEDKISDKINGFQLDTLTTLCSTVSASV